jgi:hypothetical protein
MGDAVVEGEKTIAVTASQSTDSDSFIAEFVYQSDSSYVY